MITIGPGTVNNPAFRRVLVWRPTQLSRRTTRDARSQDPGWGSVLADNFGQTTYHRKGETTAQRSWLSPQHTYTYTIQAVDYSGNRSGVSNSVSYTTPPDVTPPTAPTLTVSQVAPARLTAQWTQSLDDTTFFVFYTLLVDGSPHAGDLVQGRAQTVLNLTPSTTYTLRVTARDPYGNTSQSNTVSATTPPRTDTVPPTAPANLRGRDGGTCETYMSFDLSTDNADTQSNLVYRMYVNGLLAPRSMVRAVGRTTVFQQSLVPGVNSFVVEALDSSGNVSTPSNEFLLNATGC